MSTREQAEEIYRRHKEKRARHAAMFGFGTQPFKKDKSMEPKQVLVAVLFNVPIGAAKNWPRLIQQVMNKFDGQFGGHNMVSMSGKNMWIKIEGDDAEWRIDVVEVPYQ